jgi:putative spermidine/putrescine transport system permease protein
MTSIWRWVLVAPAVAFLSAFLVAPLVSTFERSLRSDTGYPSLARYAEFLTDAFYIEVAVATILLASLVAVLSLIAGYPLAYCIARFGGWRRSVLIFLVVTPLLTNVVVRTFGWMVIFGSNGLVNNILASLGLPTVDIARSWAAIVIAMVHVMLPFMVLSIASKLQTIDIALENAAATLGADRWKQFRWVIIPLSLDGILTGAALVFCLTMGSFVTVMLMGDNATLVLPVLIYQQLTVASDWPLAATLGVVLTAAVLLFLALQSMLVRVQR